ncbi:MAG: T9SS type A sorting domain-containing protein, partial [Bacteroidia bacterium]
WNKMEPDTKGKFCNSCSKSVVDFTNKTDDQIRDILLEHKNEKVCGHFKKTQINRPLNITIDFNNLPKNMSTTKAFAVALFLVFGTFLFSCTDLQGKKVDTIEVVNNKPEEITMGITIPNILPEDTIPASKIGEVQCFTESVVNGGMMVEEVEIVPDSIIPIKIVPEENYIMGAMVRVIDIVEEDTTATQTDSVEIKNIDRLLNPSLVNKTTDLSVYPNPSNGEFTIKYDVLKRADIKVDILDMKGVLLKTVVNVSGQFEGKYQIPVNINELPNGIYIVSLTNNGKRFTEKMIIEK